MASSSQKIQQTDAEESVCVLGWNGAHFWREKSFHSCLDLRLKNILAAAEEESADSCCTAEGSEESPFSPGMEEEPYRGPDSASLGFP